MPRARRKKNVLDDIERESVNFGQFSGLEDILNARRMSQDQIPAIVGTTMSASGNRIGDDLAYRQWLMDSPQERFANSALGRMVGAGALDRSGDTGYYGDWADDNSYWGGLTRNIVSGGAMPTARLSNIFGVEGEMRPALKSYVDEARYQTGASVEDILNILRSRR